MHPILSLYSANHPHDCYGYKEVHVLAFNVDGQGDMLTAVLYEGNYILMTWVRGDAARILCGDDDGVLYYEPGPLKRSLPSPRRRRTSKTRK
jgi:hypothetical protein